MKVSFLRAGKHILLGHLVGFGLTALLSCATLLLPYPAESVTLVGLLSASVGALFLGILLRSAQAALGEAVLSGLGYALVPFLVSLFGTGERFSLWMKVTVFAVLTVLALVPGIFFHPQKKRRRVTRR